MSKTINHFARSTFISFCCNLYRRYKPLEKVYNGISLWKGIYEEVVEEGVFLELFPYAHKLPKTKHARPKTEWKYMDSQKISENYFKQSTAFEVHL